MRSPIWLVLLGVVCLLPDLAAQGGSGTITGEVWVRERANGEHSLLVAVESPDKIARVQINLPDKFSLVPVPILPSWTSSVDGKKLTATGEPFFRVNLRFDVKREDDLIRKLTGKEIDLEVGTPGSTKLVRLKLRCGTRPPVQLQTSLDGALTAPPEVTSNQPFFVTFEPEFRGGVWVPVANVTGSAADREEARKNAVREAAKRTEALSRETSQFFRSLAFKQDQFKRDEKDPPQPKPQTPLVPQSAFAEQFALHVYDEFLEELAQGPFLWRALTGRTDAGPTAITGGTPMVFAGKNACVAGRFPTELGGLEEAAKALMLDGRPLEPRAASPTTIVVHVEADTKPGPRTIGWNNMAGAIGELPIIVLGLEGTIDRDKLMRGESTTMRLRILGGAQRIALRIVNQTPSIIQVEGGDSQVVTTSGGFDNVVTREVRGIRKGNFAIDYSLDQPPCGGGR